MAARIVARSGGRPAAMPDPAEQEDPVGTARDPAMERDVLAELAAVLAARDHPHGRLVLARSPLLHARSTIYFVADEDRPSLGPQWVVKRPDDKVIQEDVASPPAAAHQFAAPEAPARHFDTAPSGVHAVQPVGLLAGVEAVAMDYVHGTPLDRRVRPRALADPSALLGGVSLSGVFLRHLHTIRPSQDGQVDLA